MTLIQIGNVGGCTGHEKPLPVIKRINQPHEPPGGWLVGAVKHWHMINQQASETTGNGQIVARAKRRLAQIGKRYARHISRHPVKADLTPGNTNAFTANHRIAGQPGKRIIQGGGGLPVIRHMPGGHPRQHLRAPVAAISNRQHLASLLQQGNEWQKPVAMQAVLVEFIRMAI